MRNHPDTDQDRVIDLASALLPYADAYQVIIEKIAHHFDAGSGVIWIRSQTSQDEFVAEGVFNRPDLNTSNNQFISFRMDDGYSISTTTPPNVIVSGPLGEAPFDKEWLSKPHTKGLLGIGAQSALICPIFENDGDLYGSISLYFIERSQADKTDHTSF